MTDDELVEQCLAALRPILLSGSATVRAEGRADGAREEREAVVRFLRAEGQQEHAYEALSADYRADQIERGDHLAKGDR